MRVLLCGGDHGPHLHAGLQPVAHHPCCGRLGQRRLNISSASPTVTASRSRQAALAGVAEGAVGDDLRGHLESASGRMISGFFAPPWAWTRLPLADARP